MTAKFFIYSNIYGNSERSESWTSRKLADLQSRTDGSSSVENFLFLILGYEVPPMPSAPSENQW